MRRVDATSDLQDGIEPAPGPSPQADGLPGFAAKRPELPPRPRLCEQGPCRHYHRLELQVESADPRAQRVPVRLPVLPVGAQAVPDGTLYQAPATYHTSVSHYCYPDLGIETNLGDAPVVSCNRWDPMDDETLLQRVKVRFLETERGRAYLSQVATWEQARAKEAQDAHDAETLIADSLIDAQMERYTFHAEERGDRWVAGCDAFPGQGTSATARTRTGAVDALRGLVAKLLLGMYTDGLPFPDPPQPNQEQIIESQLAKYTFEAYEGEGQLVPKGRWLAACDALWGIHPIGHSRDGAIAEAKGLAREYLRECHDHGRPFPEPPPKE